jgi:hypothetical protein
MQFSRPELLTLPKRRDERIVLAACLAVLLAMFAILGVRLIRAAGHTGFGGFAGPLILVIYLDRQLAILAVLCAQAGVFCATLIESTSAYWVAPLAAVPIGILDFVLRARRARAAGMDGGRPA